MLRQLRGTPVQAARLQRLLAAFLDGAHLLSHTATPLAPQLEVQANILNEGTDFRV